MYIKMSQRLFINKFFTFIAPQVRARISVLQCKRNKISMNVQCLCRNTSNYNKAILPQQHVDLLMQNIRSATDASDVLYYVQQHHAIMNDAHITLALNSLFTLQKSQKSTFTNGELVRHESFQLLCKLLQQKIRFLELNDHLNALKVMSFVGVPSTHKIIQILLQLVSKQVNEMSLQQIVFLDFILKDFESCPLVDALRIALPIVFEAHFRLQKEGCDMKQLSEFFVFAIRRKLSDKCIDVFVNTMFENRSNLDVESSKTILRTLCDAKKSEMPYRTLLHQCLDNVVDNINNFTFLDLNYILSRLTSNYNKKNGSYFYHEEFINSCANYVIDKNCDDEQITWVLKSCNKFKHMHKQILDRLSDRIAENPDRLEKWSAGMFVSFIRSLSIADYRPNNFSVYEEYLIDNLLKLTSRLELPWLRTALHLCSLDCWPYELFNTIFDEQFLDQFLKRGNSGDSHDLINLYQAIVTLCPAYKGNMPSPNIINKIINKVKLTQDNFKSSLLPSLIQGLGGPSYVFSSLHTKLGHSVDHAVVMRKGGYFVSINNDPENCKSSVIVEDIPLPEDSQLVLILYIPPRSYTLNTERMQGETRLNINTLEAMGFSVVPVLESVWVNLLDSEKIPYLMQALQNKSVTQENVAASQT